MGDNLLVKQGAPLRDSAVNLLSVLLLCVAHVEENLVLCVQQQLLTGFSAGLNQSTGLAHPVHDVPQRLGL